MSRTLEIPKPQTQGRVDAVAAVPKRSIHDNAEVTNWSVGDWVAWVEEAYTSLAIPDPYRPPSYNEFNTYSAQTKRNVGVVLEQFYKGMEAFDRVIAPHFSHAKARSLIIPTLHIARTESMYDPQLNQPRTTYLFFPEQQVYVNIDATVNSVRRDFEQTHDSVGLVGKDTPAKFQRAGIRGRFFLEGVEVMAYNFFASEYGVDNRKDFEKMGNASSLAAHDGVPMVMFGLLSCAEIATYFIEGMYGSRRITRGTVDISDETVEYLLWRIEEGWKNLPSKWQKKLQPFRQGVENNYAASRANRFGNESEKAA